MYTAGYRYRRRRKKRKKSTAQAAQAARAIQHPKATFFSRTDGKYTLTESFLTVNKTKGK